MVFPVTIECREEDSQAEVLELAASLENKQDGVRIFNWFQDVLIQDNRESDAGRVFQDYVVSVIFRDGLVILTVGDRHAKYEKLDLQDFGFEP